MAGIEASAACRGRFPQTSHARSEIQDQAPNPRQAGEITPCRSQPLPISNARLQSAHTAARRCCQLRRAGRLAVFWLDIGVSLTLFLGVLGLTAVACNGVRAPRHTRMVMTRCLSPAWLALIENVNMLSVSIGLLATAMFIIVMTAERKITLVPDLLEAATVPVRGPFQFVGDIIRRASTHQAKNFRMAGLARGLDRSVEHLRDLSWPCSRRQIR